MAPDSLRDTLVSSILAVLRTWIEYHCRRDQHHMKRIVMAVVLIGIAMSVTGIAQDEHKEYMRTLLIGPGLQVSVLHLNEKTLPVIFQPPTIYAMRARAREGTLVFVQGTTERELEIDPGQFRLEQGGKNTAGKPVNIKNFQKGKIGGGQRIDGLVQFEERIDLSKPFSIKYGKESAEFRFTPDQVKAMAPPPAQD
jgi:hypothetical protein